MLCRWIRKTSIASTWMMSKKKKVLGFRTSNPTFFGSLFIPSNKCNDLRKPLTWWGFTPPPIKRFACEFLHRDEKPKTATCWHKCVRHLPFLSPLVGAGCSGFEFTTYCHLIHEVLCPCVLKTFCVTQIQKQKTPRGSPWQKKAHPSLVFGRGFGLQFFLNRGNPGKKRT
jgi:hypothetical protein